LRRGRFRWWCRQWWQGLYRWDEAAGRHARW
jgi:hypothetical protein